MIATLSIVSNKTNAVNQQTDNHVDMLINLNQKRKRNVRSIIKPFSNT